MRILVWNMAGNNLAGHLARCLKEHEVDFAVICEPAGLDLHELAAQVCGAYELLPAEGGCDKVVCMGRRGVSVSRVIESTRYVVNLVEYGHDHFILAGVHLPDRRNYCVAARVAVARRVMEDVESLERSGGCRDVVIAGDFNANPYDDEMLQPDSFNAVLFRGVIDRSETCIFAGMRYRRMYNPTVHFLSEDGPNYGSHYWLPAGEVGPIWNCLDQVIVSKSLAGRVREYRYLRSVGDVDLMARVRPRQDISDHLPLLVGIEDGRA